MVDGVHFPVAGWEDDAFPVYRRSGDYFSTCYENPFFLTGVFIQGAKRFPSVPATINASAVYRRACLLPTRAGLSSMPEPLGLAMLYGKSRCEYRFARSAGVALTVSRWAPGVTSVAGKRKCAVILIFSWESDGVGFNSTFFPVDSYFDPRFFPLRWMYAAG